MVNGDFGGGSLEHPRQRLGAQWAGIFLGLTSCLVPSGAPRGGTGAQLGHCQRCTLTMLRFRWRIVAFATSSDRRKLNSAAGLAGTCGDRTPRASEVVGCLMACV